MNVENQREELEDNHLHLQAMILIDTITKEDIIEENIVLQALEVNPKVKVGAVVVIVVDIRVGEEDHTIKDLSIEATVNKKIKINKNQDIKIPRVNHTLSVKAYLVHNLNLDQNQDLLREKKINWGIKIKNHQTLNLILNQCLKKKISKKNFKKEKRVKVRVIKVEAKVLIIKAVKQKVKATVLLKIKTHMKTNKINKKSSKTSHRTEKPSYDEFIILLIIIVK